LPVLQHADFSVAWEEQKIAPQNWNATWEASFDPVEVDQRCRVRASFHAPSPSHAIEIVIDPKMAFGTGHHQTTWLMMHEMLDMDWNGTTVLDMGSGTAVLAILASLRGAEEVLAIDNDAWAVDNARENLQTNDIQNVQVLQGEADTLGDRVFNRILANINKNVILADIGTYARCLETGGQLVCSGFFAEDVPDITRAAEGAGLIVEGEQHRQQWALVRFHKP
ncbi:MAG: 50S ribosomal protein L11 methyltransferase, partial [Bacteroidota bacterium]